jgi:hypothetical protein
MKKLIFVLCLAAITSCKESKSKRITKLNQLIKIELDYKDKLSGQITLDSTRNARLLSEVKGCDKTIDSLGKEIDKIQAE